MELIERFKALKAEKERYDRELTSEESAFKTIKSQYDEETRELFTKYNVRSIDEAKALLVSEEKRLEGLIQQGETVVKTLSNALLTSTDIGL